VLNVEANVKVDFAALEAVKALRDEFARDGTVFAMARVKQDLLVAVQADRDPGPRAGELAAAQGQVDRAGKDLVRIQAHTSVWQGRSHARHGIRPARPGGTVRRRGLAGPVSLIRAGGRSASPISRPLHTGRQAALCSGCSSSCSCARGCCGSEPVPAAPRCSG